MTIKSQMKVVSTAAAPFAVPPVIVLDLPAPPSVNRTRRIDFRSLRKSNEWAQTADALVMATHARIKQPRGIKGPFELAIIVSERHTRIDLDNGLKALIDYLRRIEVIEDDNQHLMRRITVEWGEAPEGCRVHVRGLA